MIRRHFQILIFLAELLLSAPALATTTTDINTLSADFLFESGPWTYNGQPQERKLNLASGSTLAQGTDFTLTYENHINATSPDSKALAVITGIGAYHGRMTFAYDI